VGKSMGKECDCKSEEMPKYLQELLEIQGTEFLDTRDSVPMNTIDYMHLDKEGHRLLAKLVFNKIKNIL
jgi:lysophospholipase L1-like esterase